MKDFNITITPTNFPNQEASDSKKATIEYGQAVGEAIQYEWFRRDGNGCRFYNQLENFHRLRLYARGEQPIGKYKNEIAVDGDLSYLNLDWTPVPIIPKFVDIVVNGMGDRLFDLRAYAQDALSNEKKMEFQNLIKADMIAKDVLSTAATELDLNMFNVEPDTLPESDSELELYMNMHYKPALEIAEEEGINTILEMNHYKSRIRNRINYD